MVSLWCELLCKLSIYTLKSNQRITIWCAKFELECLLLIFIYSSAKFKVTCKNVNFECEYIRTHSEENRLKISNFTFAILPFCHQNTLTQLPSRVLWILLLLLKPSDAPSNRSITQSTQDPEFANLKCVTSTQPIPLALIHRETFK